MKILWHSQRDPLACSNEISPCVILLLRFKFLISMFLMITLLHGSYNNLKSLTRQVQVPVKVCSVGPQQHQLYIQGLTDAP